MPRYIPVVGVETLIDMKIKTAEQEMLRSSNGVFRRRELQAQITCLKALRTQLNYICPVDMTNVVPFTPLNARKQPLQCEE